MQRRDGDVRAVDEVADVEDEEQRKEANAHSPDRRSSELRVIARNGNADFGDNGRWRHRRQGERSPLPCRGKQEWARPPCGHGVGCTAATSRAAHYMGSPRKNAVRLHSDGV